MVVKKRVYDKAVLNVFSSTFTSITWISHTTIT